MNIVELIFSENSDNNGFALIEGGRSVSYPELFGYVRSIASQLNVFGVTKGTYAVLCLRGGVDYIIVSLAMLLCGGVIVPISETVSDDEIRDVVRTSGAAVLISGRNFRDLQPISFQSGILSSAICLFKTDGGAGSDSRIREIDAAFVRFSSGTTGASKGVLLSHRSIKERTDAADKALKMTRQDRVIWVLNMSFHFVVTILLFLRRGTTIVICEEDFPRSFLRAITEVVPTFLYASPFHYSLLAKTSGLSRDIFRNVRLAISTAMSLSVEIANGFFTISGIYPSQAYGIIEVGLPFVNTSQDPAKLMSVGRLLPDYQLKLTDTDDQGRGRIFLRGMGLFDAYLQPTRLAKEVFVDGWFETGDIGGLDNDGYLFITGRTKNVINFCGMKIFPEEVERILNQYPGVTESQVYGKPHPEYGQMVCANIVASESLVLDDLRLDCYRRLAKYKVPKEFYFVSELSKTPSGKVRRF
jgi:long-chain acyl-CoA synthetase